MTIRAAFIMPKSRGQNIYNKACWRRFPFSNKSSSQELANGMSLAVQDICDHEDLAGHVFVCSPHVPQPLSQDELDDGGNYAEIVVSRKS